MQIVIDIPVDVYKWVIKHDAATDFQVTQVLYKRIKEGKALPIHHGRLIDADAFEEILLDESLVGEVQDAIDELGHRPTILESTGE